MGCSQEKVEEQQPAGMGGGCGVTAPVKVVASSVQMFKFKNPDKYVMRGM